METTLMIPRYSIRGLQAGLHSLYEDFTVKADTWQDLYDDRESNEPEYDSQIERWQEALDRLEEDLDDLNDTNEDFESWLEQFDEAIHSAGEKGLVRINYQDYWECQVNTEEFAELLNRYLDINYRRKGLTPMIKSGRVLLAQFNKWSAKG